MWLDTHPKLSSSEFHVFAKSSMDTTDDSYTGRPFGGLAIIARKHKLFNISEVECVNDRLLVAAYKDSCDNLSQIICNIYMPFYDSSKLGNTDQYINVVDELQTLTDKYNKLCPIKLFGDFNVQLPTQEPQSSSWYHGKGFSKHSAILFNFMKANDFTAVDLTMKQAVKYTYFCHKRNVFTWIDHALCTHYDMCSVMECKIIMHSPDNDSDHLPLYTVFSLNSGHIDNTANNVSGSASQVISWKNDVFLAKYRTLLDNKLSVLKSIEVGQTHSVTEAQSEVDRFMDGIRQAIKESVSEASDKPKAHFTPKPYWCPELSEARNRKRFWWRLWVDCGRPREGATYECYKGVKKMFRRLSRECMDKVLNNGFTKFNELYYKKNLHAFWLHVKRSRRHFVNSALKVETLATHYENIMTDNGILNHEQEEISESVDNFYDMLSSQCSGSTYVRGNDVSAFIDKLNNNSAPGIDDITSEHLKYGKSAILCETLSRLYSCILSWQVVPSVFNIGVIIPVLKKPSLNPNDAGSYRPVTLSSVFSKILEKLMLPDDNVSNSQYGFRKGRGTSLACALFNDFKCYFEYTNAPLFTCSLDAEKCFDSIWHKALLYKLRGKISNNHWLILYRWYGSLKATVKLNNNYSKYFTVSKGTRQGSLLSPQLFNIFIDDLLQELSNSDDKVCIGTCQLNSFAYADDINLLCTTSPGLQRLINICAAYADKWRFKFGISKTKCMAIAGSRLANVPTLYLNNEPIASVSCLEILGVHYDSKNTAQVEHRINKCKRAFYSLRDIGMAYPGCASDVKAYLWNTMCQPILIYGFDSLFISQSSIDQLETIQGNLVKQCMGLSKRSRSTNLLQALHITRVREKIRQSTASLLKRVFSVESSVKDLNAHLLSLYVTRGDLIPGTLIQRAVCMGLSPISCAFQEYKKPVFIQGCGIVDSIKHLVMHENFIKPYSEEFILSSLLTKAF